MKHVIKLLGIVMLGIPLTLPAGTDWTRVAANTVVIMDWAQTRNIDQHPSLYETNKITGRYPSDAEINRFFILELLAYNLIGEYLISEKYQVFFYGGLIMIHGDAVLHNYNMGVRLQFD